MAIKPFKQIPPPNTVYISTDMLPNGDNVKSIICDISDLFIIFYSKISLVLKDFDETVNLFKFIIELTSEIKDMKTEFVADGYIEIMAVIAQDFYTEVSDSVAESVDMYMLIYDNEPLLYNICEIWLKLRSYQPCIPYRWHTTVNNKFNTNNALLDVRLLCIIKQPE